MKFKNKSGYIVIELLMAVGLIVWLLGIVVLICVGVHFITKLW